MQARLCLKVPAEDHVSLATDVYLPDGPGPFPAIVQRTPYHRANQQEFAPIFTGRGYAFVTQDCRGKYDSDGVFTPLVDEARDGQATLDWVANQRWCNGRIGLWGRSYSGMVQVPAASGGHAALRCIVPSVSPSSFFRDWIRHDGCFALDNALYWAITHASCRTQPASNHFARTDLHPLETMDAITDRVGMLTPALGAWASHDRYDDYWQAIDQDTMHHRVEAAGLHTGGWFDHVTRGNIAAFCNIRQHGPTDFARTHQKMILGPWGHKNLRATGPSHTHYGEWDFGAEADVSVLKAELECLDFYLKDIDNGYAQQAAVSVFLMGDNRWIGFDGWPPKEAAWQTWYLDSEGSATMRVGDGQLLREVPQTSTQDSYRYDPQYPVPTLGGPVFWGLDVVGPVDQRPLLDRSDVLFYRSPRLREALAVIGEVTLDLFIASNVADTDFVAKLCVQEPTGPVTVLTLGSLRCRYRESWSEPKPLPPNDAVPIRLHLGHTAYRFPKGSRICLMITSSEFPRIQPHPNTLAGPWQATEWLIAQNSVLHGPAMPSCLNLPVVEVA